MARFTARLQTPQEIEAEMEQQQQTTSNEYTITKFNNDWYNFEELPQEHSYFQIHNMRCETERKAINKARKILGNKKAIIKIKQQDLKLESELIYNDER